jgi:N-acetylmuramoyl-L-alanine amidase
MKKRIKKLVLILALIITSFTGQSFAETPISVFINGNIVNFDTPQLIENGRTLVPLRVIFEGLGAEVNFIDFLWKIIYKNFCNMFQVKVCIE